jgi:hypothetical protein
MSFSYQFAFKIGFLVSKKKYSVYLGLLKENFFHTLILVFDIFRFMKTILQARTKTMK